MPSKTDDQQSTPIKKYGILANLSAGAAARCTSACIMYPIDVIKTRLQFERGDLIHGRSGALQVARAVLAQEGARGFYRGLSVRLIYVAPAAAVSFSFYEQFKRAFSQLKKKHTASASATTTLAAVTPPSFNGLFGESGMDWISVTLATLAAGAGARMVGTACRTPLDILKQRLQLGKMQGQDLSKAGRGIFSTLGDIVKDRHGGGFKGLWAGYGITLVRDVPFSAIYFTTYEVVKYWEKLILDRKDLAPQQHLVAGASAGTVATVCTIWADVVKTRLQTQSALPLELRKYKGVAHAIKTIWAEEGIHGLTRGLGPRLCYIIPASSVTFACYELYKKFLIERSNSQSKSGDAPSTFNA